MSRVKFNFIINCTDSELIEYKKKDVISNANIFCRWDLEWCLQAYLILSERKNVDVLCSNRLREDCINIIHSAQLLAAKGKPSHFIVCVRADFPKRIWAHYHLVQNKNQLSSNTSLIPLWLQPGLIKRNRNRNGVGRIAYAGQTFNGNLAGTVDTWKKLFEPYNLDFVSLPSGDCSDLSSIDILIGIRSFDSRAYNTKPPSKLINAWHADIPFIGGNDSAFKQVGVPMEDYLIAQSPQEVVDAVLLLRDNPDLYSKLVHNGEVKATKYTTATIAEAWENILSGSVLKRYEKWKSRPLFEKALFTARLNQGVLIHKAKQLIKKIIRKK